MVKDTGIEWADDTFNPWQGCSKVSPACGNCYAMDHVNRYGGDFLGKRVMTSDGYWKEPLKWNKEAEKSGQMRRVFCASLSDVFEDYQGPIVNHKGQRLAVWPDGSRITIDQGDILPHIPGGPRSHWMTMSDARWRLFNLIDSTPNLVWMLLTKRPENIQRMWPVARTFIPEALKHGQRRQNVWLGTTVENQEQADKRIPELLKCSEIAPVLFLSCEPLLGAVDLTRVEGNIGRGLHSFDVLNGRNYHWDDGGQWTPSDKIGWVICGGESGKNARPMNPQWALSMRDQCKAAGIPFHFKQWGEFDAQGNRVGKKQAGRLLDGQEWNGLPTEWHLQQMADDAQRLDMGY